MKTYCCRGAFYDVGCLDECITKRPRPREWLPGDCGWRFETDDRDGKSFLTLPWGEIKAIGETVSDTPNLPTIGYVQVIDGPQRGGTVALIERLRMSAGIWGDDDGGKLYAQAADTIARLEAERDAARRIIYDERQMHEARVNHAVKLLTGIHSLLYPAPATMPDGRVMVFRPEKPHEFMQTLSDRIRALPDELEKMPGLTYENAVKMDAAISAAMADESIERKARREAMEQCARIAESFVWFEHDKCSPDEGNVRIAAAIRAAMKGER